MVRRGSWTNIDAVSRFVDDLPQAFKRRIGLYPAEAVAVGKKHLRDFMSVRAVYTRLWTAQADHCFPIHSRTHAQPELPFAGTPRKHDLAEPCDLVTEGCPRAVAPKPRDAVCARRNTDE